jgi:hypothetical protein
MKTLGKRGDSMDREYLCWLGGFFDGEGFVTFRNRPSGRHFILGVGQSGDRGRAVLQELMDRSEVGQMREVKRREHYQPFWDWRVTRVHDVVWFGELLLPFLRVKHEDVAAMLDVAKSVLPTMRAPFYSAREVQFIERHYETMTLAQMAAALHRTEKGLDDKLRHMGVGKRRDARSKAIDRACA